MMKTLFLHPPSFDGFDGGAGSRYQARREIRSFWYPTWLAQPAALVAGSRLIDAPPARHRRSTDVLPLAKDYELVVLHTSTPSFANDVKVAAGDEGSQSGAQDRLRRRQGRGRAGGEPAGAATAIDFVARNEFDFTIKEVAEGRAVRSRSTASAIATRDGRHRPQRRARDPRGHGRLPFVTEVYKRDLEIENYFIGYLKHPYSRSIPAAAASRAAPSACGRRPWAAIATGPAASATSSRRSAWPSSTSRR